MSEDSLSITLLNDLAAVPDAAERVEAFCRDRGIPRRIAHRFSLALDESLTNAVSHAFPDGGSHRIDVRVEHRGSYLSATVSDDGTAFDPLAQPPPDVHAPIEERTVGGLGIHLLRSLTDAVEYRRLGDRNNLTFRIRIVEERPPQ